MVLLGPIVLSALLPLTSPSETILHAFRGANRDGQAPLAGLVAASDGRLFGTTDVGSNSTCLLSFGFGCGVVFALTPTPTGYAERLAHRFHGPPHDGLHPQGGLIVDAHGALYGTTVNGGAFTCTVLGGSLGCGTAFKLTPRGHGYVEDILHSFGATTNDGVFPLGNLVADGNGALYAATEFGGDQGLGAIVKLTPGRGGYAERVIFSFASSGGGYYPMSGLIADAQGALYGTTFSGGSPACGPAHAGCGTVFKLTLTASGNYAETVLYAFVGGTTDGAYPEANVAMDASGALYGTTTSGGNENCSDPPVYVGCGTVFKLTPHGSGYAESIPYAFQGGADGFGPVAGPVVLADGSIFGTATQGGNTLCSSGTGTGCGTLFGLTPSRKGYTFRILHTFFGGSDGASPEAPLVAIAGRLFGTTAFGGGSGFCGGSGSLQFGCGTAFSLQP
jgi:hypothetical protein